MLGYVQLLCSQKIHALLTIEKIIFKILHRNCWSKSSNIWTTGLRQKELRVNAHVYTYNCFYTAVSRLKSFSTTILWRQINFRQLWMLAVDFLPWYGEKKKKKRRVWSKWERERDRDRERKEWCSFLPKSH